MNSEIQNSCQPLRRQQLSVLGSASSRVTCGLVNSPKPFTTTSFSIAVSSRTTTAQGSMVTTSRLAMLLLAFFHNSMRGVHTHLWNTADTVGFQAITKTLIGP